MSDPSVWQSLIHDVGGPLVAAAAALFGTNFIVPKATRDARKADSRDKAHAIMREKAEAIFAAINEARRTNNGAIESMISELGKQAPELRMLEVIPLRSFDQLTPLIVTYYPEVLPVLAAGMDKMRTKTQAEQQRVARLPFGSSEHNVARTAYINKASTISFETLANVERAMVDAVKPYAPVATL